MVIEQIPKSIGFIYALVMILVMTYLWYSGRWRNKNGWVFLIISTALGFLIFTPVIPYQIQQLVLRDEQGLGAPLIAGVIGLLIVLILTFVVGRFFCGYFCPVGTIQEIAYHVPVPKVTYRQKKMFMLVRAVFFIFFLLMSFLFSTSVIAWFGIRDFFYLSLTSGAFVFIIILLISIILYRPFCRLVCPYGAILSLGAWKCLFKLQRTDACISCKKCEKACPTDEAKQNDGKMECYLCGRCTDVCPVPGALKYKRRNGDEKIT